MRNSVIAHVATTRVALKLRKQAHGPCLAVFSFLSFSGDDVVRHVSRASALSTYIELNAARLYATSELVAGWPTPLLPDSLTHVPHNPDPTQTRPLLILPLQERLKRRRYYDETCLANSNIYIAVVVSVSITSAPLSLVPGDV